IGNNINQITRNYNSKLYRTEDRELLSAYMKKLNITVREAADKISSM
ncbi:MAG: MobC family plasmid mobilization relaxosome protein, partial [Schaedlerella sp.]